ncbi:DUF1120 domain-containing protein [Serratia marcescens]|uniref:DUF1120 domain-containing protein n=1 Tax=Serratia marcescens TaxID=615 RepID=UPI000A0C78B7|nr:DUF1120 domain-containing protein [Serratia marcescens]OQV35958.1 hypothetical protein BV901_10285 [Serratia nematodiphila]WGL77982.1 DUF1120 domain-containing protein [Serratia marcescens]
MGKNLILYGGGVAGLLLAGHLTAAPASEIRVAGEIQQPGCMVIPPNGGSYDFGALPRVSVVRGKTEALPAMTQTWRVRCDSVAYLAVTPLDNRMMTVSTPAETHFGLGASSEGAALGYFQLGVANAQADGSRAMLKMSRGEMLSHQGATLLSAGKRVEWTGNNDVRRGAKDYAMDITVTPYLVSGSLAPASSAELDGSVTLNFDFGL